MWYAGAAMIIHLTGPDTYRSLHRLQQLREAFRAKHDPSGLNIVQLDGATVTVPELRSAIQTTGMFSTRRCIIIDRYPDRGGVISDKVLVELLHPYEQNNEVIIIIRQETVPPKRKSKKTTTSAQLHWPDAKAEIFTQLTPLELVRWLQLEAKAQGGSIEPAAADRLGSMVRTSWQAHMELDKLLAFVGDRPITVADVEGMVTGQEDSNIFALTDAVGQRQPAAAVRALHREFSAGTHPLVVTAALANHIRTIMRVKQAADRMPAPAIAAELGLHPFVVKKSLAQAQRASMETLATFHHQLMEIDLTMKSSPLDPEGLLERAVLDLA